MKRKKIDQAAINIALEAVSGLDLLTVSEIKELAELSSRQEKFENLSEAGIKTKREINLDEP